MATTSQDIDRALKRLVALGSPDVSHSPMLAGSRRVIVETLIAADTPLTIGAIAAATNLHVNTARHHLDVLAAADLVTRHTAPATGRGRPRVLYAASAAAAEPYEELEDFLTRAVVASVEDDVAIETARRWARSVPQVTVAADIDQAVAAAVESLQKAGFRAHTDEIGDTITMSGCPYAGLIEDHPMICTIHAELVSTLLERTGQPVTLEAFDVWVRPGVCRARLSRPDVTPARVATAPSSPRAGKEKK